MDSKHPPTPEQLDELVKIRRDSSRILGFTAIAVSLVVVVVLLVGGVYAIRVIHEITTANDSSCALFADIGTLPVTLSGPMKTPKFAIKLIIDGRTAYIERNCPGQLPDPSSELRKLASEYRISLADSSPITASAISSYLALQRR